jgi:hypothetical protein
MTGKGALTGANPAFAAVLARKNSGCARKHAAPESLFPMGAESVLLSIAIAKTGSVGLPAQAHSTPAGDLFQSVFSSGAYKTLGAPSIPRILRNGWESTTYGFSCKHLS